jgi:hypothetical protein
MNGTETFLMEAERVKARILPPPETFSTEIAVAIKKINRGKRP